MRKVIASLFLLTIFLAPRQEINSASAEALFSPGEVISALNQYRAQNGLYALQSNSILMTTAQDQSDYMASTGSISHTGPGGTSPKDRAYAAGYGDGQIIFLSEIIYGGSNATVDDAMAFWKSSPDHNPWVLSSNYVHIGAGVATDGTSVYYTAVMANPAGGVAPTPGASDGDEDTGEEIVTIPVMVSTPNADGSVVHIVQSGQTLFKIAQAYAVALADIFELNAMNENTFIYPGDEILVKPAETQVSPTPTATQPNPTATRTPRATSVPTITPAPAILAGAAGQGEQPAAISKLAGEDTSLRWIVILAVAGIFFIMMGGFLVPRTKEEN